MISPALQQLYDEHEHILGVISRMNTLLESDDLANYATELNKALQFFRIYGDEYHHQKEEGILFPTLADVNPAIESLVDSLTEHHVDFREVLGEAGAVIASQDWETARRLLLKYGSDLTDHISAENDELFVAADDMLASDEKERLYFQFMDRDCELGEERKRMLEREATNG